MRCWGCGRTKRRGHPGWCPAPSAEPHRTYEQRRVLKVLIRQQERDMTLRRYFQPPEWPQGVGKVLSYTAWAYERGGGRYE